MHSFSTLYFLSSILSISFHKMSFIVILKLVDLCSMSINFSLIYFFVPVDCIIGELPASSFWFTDAVICSSPI